MPCWSSYLLFFILWDVTPLLSQSPQSRTYTISDGMPMTEVSVIHCDRDGRIWSVYNNAMVSSFDGRKFTTYTPEVTGHYFSGGHIAEDQYGMWLWDLKESISLFSEGVWTSWKSPGFCAAVVDKKLDRLVIVDTMGVLFSLDAQMQTWTPVAKVPLEVQKPGLQYDLHSSLNEDRYLLKVLDMQNRTLLTSYTCTSLTEPTWIEDPSLNEALFFWSEGNLSNLSPIAQYPGFRDEQSGATFRYGFRINDKLLVYNNRLISQPNIWEMTLYILEPTGQIRQLCQFTHTHAEVNLDIDRQGHIWAGSQVGLTCIYPEILTCTEANQNMVSNLHVINEDDQGRIWFGGYSNGLCYYNGVSIQPAPADAAQFKRFLPGALQTPEGTMGFWTEDYGVVMYEKGKWHYSKSRAVDPSGDRGYYLLALHNGMVAAGLMNDGLGIGFQSFSPSIEWNKINKSKGLLLDNVITISEDSEGRLWTGRATQGIALYDPLLDTAITWLRSEDRERGFGAMSSAIDSDGALWFGGHDGLYFLEKPPAFDMFRDDVFEKAKKVDMSEAGTTQVSLLKEYRGYLIFGNKHGYGFLDLRSQKIRPFTPRIFFYPTDPFLKSCDQNTILIDSRGDVWIGQDLGATRIDFDQLKLDSLPVHIIIDSILAGGQNQGTNGRNLPSTALRAGSTFDAGELTSVTARHRLPRLKRHLEICLSPSFTGLLNDNVGFQYRLLHKKVQDTTWSIYSKEDRIVLSYLPPGNNKIEIRAIKNNQVADTLFLQYYVPLTLAENPLFWICLIGGISVAGGLASYRIYHQQLSIRQTRLTLKEKELMLSEREREKEQLQIKAIANALNPHFINNSLQWLQSRVRKDPDAVRMIDRFSKNIHTVFVNSRQGKAYHALGDEMELVKNYLYIQKSRYGDFVDVTLPSDEIIASLSKVQVPLMQIQIHVENAIEHGLRHRPGARKLDINMQDRGHYLHINITDDGIGRHRSQEIGSHGTQQGTAMLKSLHAIFNKHNTLPILSSYQDTPFTDADTGEQYGTTVHIEIPKEYNYELTED